MARYNPRSLNENVSQMMTFTIVPMPEAPRPWTVRPAINASIRGASAQSRLPAKKTATAISTVGFRPQISATDPQTGVMAVLARMKALPIQMYPAMDLKEPTMAGMAGVTMVRSSADSITDRQSGVMIKAMVVPEIFWTVVGDSGDEAGWTVAEPVSRPLSVGIIALLGGSVLMAVVVEPMLSGLRLFTPAAAGDVAISAPLLLAVGADG